MRIAYTNALGILSEMSERKIMPPVIRLSVTFYSTVLRYHWYHNFAMFSVQRQVFAGRDERLLAMIPVFKVSKGIRGKLNKHNILCLTGM
jgi:hypothetical protein